MKRVFLMLFVLGLSMTALAQPPEAALIIVTDTGMQMEEDGLCTLPEAVFSAGIYTVMPPAEGECALGGGRARIVLQSGQTYRVDLKPHELFTIPDENTPSTAFPVTFPQGGITITTDGEEPATIIRDENSEPFRLFFVAMHASLTLENIILSGGMLEQGLGGAVHSRGELTLEDVVLHGNSALAGGALLSIGTLTMRRSSVHSNQARDGGGLMLTGLAAIEDTQITDNSATLNGGGIHMDGFAVPANITLTRVTIADNTAINGGGVYNMVASLTLVDSVIENNSANGGNGGGLYYHDFDQINLLNLIDSTVRGNSAAYGGGLFSLTGALRLENSSILDNSASTRGADIYLPPPPG